MSTPKYLYHYTSVEALAMILSKRQFKLSPLSVLDDLKESDNRDIATIGKTVYVSSWTSNPNESIPMWNMYSKIDAGVRIKANADFFEDYKIDKNKKIWISDKAHLNDERIMMFPYLEQVKYSDLEEDICPQIIYSNDVLNQEKLGTYKNTVWKFQEEWRYIVRTWPGPKYDAEDKTIEEIYRNFSTFADDYILLNIEETAFKNLEITLSPKILEGNEVMVRLLKEKYCPNLIIKQSELKNCMR